MLKKTFVYGMLQLGVTFLIGVYIESLSSQKLLIWESIFSIDFCDFLLKHYYYVLVILGSSNLVFYYLSHQNNDKKTQEKIYNNICQLIFDKFIKTEASFQNHSFRVSLFMTKENFRGKKYLLNVGRYQTMQDEKLSCIKFWPLEGSVGICYKLGIFCFENVCEYNPQNPNPYYTEQYEKFKLPKRKVKKLGTKSRSYLSYPINYWNSVDLFGVIVVDTTMDIDFGTTNFRIIETILEHDSVMFNKPN